MNNKINITSWENDCIKLTKNNDGSFDITVKCIYTNNNEKMIKKSLEEFKTIQTYLNNMDLKG